MKITIRVYDVWGDDEDGYTVNDSWDWSQKEIDDATWSDDDALTALVCESLKNWQSVKPEELEIANGSDDMTVYYDLEANGKPFCEVFKVLED